MRNNFLRMICSIILCGMLIPACKDKYAGLTNEQETLVDAIIRKIKSDKQGAGYNFFETDSINTEGKVTESFLRYYLYGAKSLDPVELSAANALFTNHNGKIAILQAALGSSLRNTKETRSILIPADSLRVFTDSLIYYQDLLKSKTGARIVFGSYPYNGSSISFKESGRSTFFIVGTIDTTGNASKFNWSAQKDMTLLGSFLALKVRNHGELCPDSCQDFNTIYR